MYPAPKPIKATTMMIRSVMRHLGLDEFGLREKVGPNEAQIHQPRFWYAFFSPLGDRWLGYVEHASNRSGTAELIDLFGVRVFCVHVAILAIANNAVNSHG